MKVKSIDALMQYLSEHHGINISDNQKTQLRNIGYYHGFKGYRFIRTPTNQITFTDFNEIIAINHFDMALKSLIYPQMMFIETAIKNYMIEVIVQHTNTDSFDEIYEGYLTYYKTYPVGTKNYKKELNKRLGLRNKFYSTLSRDFFAGKPVVEHFYHKDEYVPIWAIFEVISLAEFGNFISCSHINLKKDISNQLNINVAYDTGGKMTETIIFLLKDLRNALAHNDAIFDTRFKRSNVNTTLPQLLSNETKIPNITFKTITDYLILMVYLQKNLKVAKTELNQVVEKFESISDKFRKEIPISMYNQILYTDTRNKLGILKSYID